MGYNPLYKQYFKIDSNSTRLDSLETLEDNNLKQNVNFDTSESGYRDDDSDTPNINIDQGFAWIVY